MPAQNKLARKYFRDGIEGEIPHVIRMEREISVMLVNTHRSLNNPRPQMPGQIDIGGAHLRSPLLLPADLQVSRKDFISFAHISSLIQITDIF